MTLPDWLVGLPDAERMRAMDAWAIEERGIPSEQLMERAGAGLARMTADVAPHGLVAVVCGGGNNGGDGYVAARLLREAGRDVRVVAVTAVDALRGDARRNAERLPGDPPEPFGPAALDGAAVAIDALLGTGFSGAPRDPARAAIAALNALAAPVVAADVASGVDASTGVVEAEAVRAAVTVTFAACKPGHWINPGKAHTGEVHTVDIGIPEAAPVEPPDVGLIGDDVLDEVPSRQAGWTKFTSGHVIVAGGARGLTGAPCLAAEAAMRAGAGYVTALVPASVEAVFEQRLLEVMTRGLTDADGAHTPDGADAVLEATARGGSLVLGPGLSRSPGALAFARDVARRAEVPLVIDADGLNAHAARLGDLSARRAPTVLTPHAGELGRLLGIDSAEVEARRLQHARAAAAQAGAVVVLKGDDTLVADPGGLVAVSPGATPALATAGTGDVLSGVLGAVLARGVDAFAAAAAAVRLHALAGIGAALERGVDAVIARDVIEGLRR
jgi:NAD(P)H-hydrate epimerase